MTYDDYDYEREYAPPLPVPDDGIKLRARTRPIGTSELALQLWHTLEYIFDEGPLNKGLALARAGRIHALKMSDNGGVSARAVGSRRYKLSLRFEAFKMASQRALLEEITEDGEVAYALSEKQIPAQLREHIFDITGEEDDLVPGGFQSSCSCPYGRHCKHVAALAALLTEAVDSDPTLLLTLRGLSRSRLQTAVKTSAANYRPVIARDVEVAPFWTLPPSDRVVVPTTKIEEILARLPAAPETIPTEVASALTSILKVVLQAAQSLA